jgi:hypothetical protein
MRGESLEGEALKQLPWSFFTHGRVGKRYHNKKNGEPRSTKTKSETSLAF